MEAAGSSFRVAATAPPTVDQVSISNVGQGVTTSGVNGLSIEYIGGLQLSRQLVYTLIIRRVMLVVLSERFADCRSYIGWERCELMHGIKLEGGGTGSGNSYGIEITTGWDIGLDVRPAVCNWQPRMIQQLRLLAIYGYTPRKSLDG